jgi:hypothetical protein
VPTLATLLPQQRAVLSLILQKDKTYDEIAALLRLEVGAVRERAHQALDALAPRDGARPAPRHRAAIGNYLLGQDPDAAPTTFAYLGTSVAGRDWARALARQLDDLAPGRLPPIPPDPDDPAPPADRLPEPQPAPSPPAAVPSEAGPQEQPPPPTGDPTPAPPVSRRGGALLIGGVLVLAAAIALAVVLLTGGSSPKVVKPTAPAAAPKASLEAQIALHPAAGVGVRGLAAVIAEGTRRGIAIAASGLQPTSARLAYGVWLYNSRADSQLIGYVPPVKADGKISAFADLPTGAGRFHTLVLTREAGNQATTPGRILLSGPIPAGSIG